MKEFQGIEVFIDPTSDYPMPYGKKYLAKGCYIQGKNIIVVGNLKDGNTIRIKYPAKDVRIHVIKESELPTDEELDTLDNSIIAADKTEQDVVIKDLKKQINNITNKVRKYK